jgi:hypothetical protein
MAFTLAFLALGWISPARNNRHLLWTFGGVGAVLIVWQLVLWFWADRRKRGLPMEWAPVKSHYVQASVQFCIYAYWGWSWRNVYEEAPLILAQVVFLYVFDALLSWSRGRTWRLGFGPWPIVFSTNFFMWFKDDWFIFQFLLVATGALGKEFIRWQRGGKSTHIFNPSAFGLAVFSAVLILTGTSHYTWGEEVATTIGNPHYIYLEIFLVSLVVQGLFSVTLMTLFSVLTLVVLNLAYTRATGVYFFIDSNIPIAVFLGLHLLVTDPSTTPKTNLGKAVFGVLYGLGVWVSYAILIRCGVPSFYDKLLVVPILNLSVKIIDRVASLGVLSKLAAWESAFGMKRLNFIHIGCWALLFMAMMATGFVEAPHPGSNIGFWKKAAEEGRPRAVQNLLIMLTDTGNGGSGDAWNELGLIYAQGKLVPTNAVEAAACFAKACELGHHGGCVNLAIQDLFLNQQQPGKDLEVALNFLEKQSAQPTNGGDCYLVGYAYDIGRGRGLDKAKAREFYVKGAGLGDVGASKNLARMEFNGEGGPMDHADAARWLEKAAQGRDADSCMKLALMYHNGDGVERDEKRAMGLLDFACSLGSQEACQALQRLRR